MLDLIESAVGLGNSAIITSALGINEFTHELYCNFSEKYKH